jgi:hypothetical protein
MSVTIPDSITIVYRILDVLDLLLDENVTEKTLHSNHRPAIVFFSGGGFVGLAFLRPTLACPMRVRTFLCLGGTSPECQSWRVKFSGNTQNLLL